jgi:hypothetical protein
MLFSRYLLERANSESYKRPSEREEETRAREGAREAVQGEKERRYGIRDENEEVEEE